MEKYTIYNGHYDCHINRDVIMITPIVDLDINELHTKMNDEDRQKSLFQILQAIIPVHYDINH